MAEYKPNSHKFKEGQIAKKEKKVEKVVTGAIATRKKSEVRQFVDEFITKDIQNVKSYIFVDVLVPAIKKAIDDIVSNGIHMLLYNGDKRGSSAAGRSTVSYGGFFKSATDRNPRPRAMTSPGGFNFEEIIFSNRGDAEAVLSAMDDIIDQYDSVSVLDLYDLADVSTTNYAAQRYGWTDIHTAKVARVEDGYVIRLPRAIPLN